MRVLLLVTAVLLVASVGSLQAETTAVFVSVYTPDTHDPNSCKVMISSGGRSESKQDLSIEAAAQTLRTMPGAGSTVWVYMRFDGRSTGLLKPLFDAVLSNPVMELRYFHDDTDPLHAEDMLQKAIPQGR